MLKSQIHDLLKSDNIPRSVVEIAKSLNKDEQPVLRAITEMSKSREIYISLVRPITTSCDHSTYYSVR